MKDVIAAIGVFIAGLLGFILLMWGLFSFAQYVRNRTCNEQWVQFPHRYSYFEECMIKVKGVWIPADNYREIAD